MLPEIKTHSAMAREILSAQNQEINFPVKVPETDI